MKRILSGIQPSGVVHLGNYLGALRNWKRLQDSSENECLYCVVDLHAITVSQDPKVLQENIFNTAALCVALGLGIDPKKSILFVQSDVPEHSELAWIFNCHVYFGELRRMTQFKDKAGKQEAATTVGLFTYPTLMAADILLYDTFYVPVGDDQKQHLELTRDIAARFNNRYGPTFRVPEPYIPETGARIMGLDDPTQKMSKSASSENNYIGLDDTPDKVRKKIKVAVTDSGREVVFDPENKPAVANLMTIYAEVTGESMGHVQGKFSGKGYGDFKKDLTDELIRFLEPIQRSVNQIRNQRSDVEQILKDGAEKARERAGKKLNEVKAKLGLAGRKA